MIRRGIRDAWPDLRGLSLLGLGYATPYLSQFRGKAERVVACMPAGQGVLHWPPEGRSRFPVGRAGGGRRGSDDRDSPAA